MSSKTELYINNTLSHFNIINLISWRENDNTPRVIQRKEEEEEEEEEE